MSAAQKFRTTFQLGTKINWFPGHMRNSLAQMQAKMRSVDVVVEVHDSRIPFSGRNPLFVKSLLGTRPHILVLAKMDLIDSSSCKKITTKYLEENQKNVIFANCLNQNCLGLKKILPLTVSLIKDSPQILTSNSIKYKVMIVGVPNVGKSSLINRLRHINLRKGKATLVGSNPGVTMSVQNEIKVCTDPPIFLIDTPGIFIPNVSDIECGMKLALCSCVKNNLIGEYTIADFLLYWMNKTENFKYVDILGLKEPIDDILPLITKIAVSSNKFLIKKNVANNVLEKIPDINFGAVQMIKLFRNGNFGDLNLDGSYF